MYLFCVISVTFTYGCAYWWKTFLRVCILSEPGALVRTSFGFLRLHVIISEKVSITASFEDTFDIFSKRGITYVGEIAEAVAFVLLGNQLLGRLLGLFAALGATEMACFHYFSFADSVAAVERFWRRCMIAIGRLTRDKDRLVLVNATRSANKRLGHLRCLVKERLNTPVLIGSFWRANLAFWAYAAERLALNWGGRLVLRIRCLRNECWQRCLRLAARHILRQRRIDLACWLQSHSRLTLEVLYALYRIHILAEAVGIA